MENLKFPVMDSLKLQLYGNVPEPQQQGRHLRSQARALEQEIGNLFVKLTCQKFPKLTPDLIGIIRYLTDKVGKISRKLNGWEATQPKERHLRELQGFPTLLFKQLWKPRRRTDPPTKDPTCQETYLPEALPTSCPNRNSAHQGSEHVALSEKGG